MPGDLLRVEVRGVGKLARDFDRMERQTQDKINASMRRVEREALPVIRSAAPYDTGELQAGITSTIFFRGQQVRVTFRADAMRKGFDYLAVTRFGHRQLRIYPRVKKALTVPIRGRRSPTTLRSSVRGSRPRKDWVVEAGKDADKVVSVETRRLSREIDTVIMR